MTYRAPVADMLFGMRHLADLEAVARLPGFEDAGLDTAQAVLEECARFNEGVVAPINRQGDVAPSTWRDGVVTTSAGFKEAFRQFGEGGWQGLQHPAEFGGQGLPKTIAAACIEMLNSANLTSIISQSNFLLFPFFHPNFFPFFRRYRTVGTIMRISICSMIKEVQMQQHLLEKSIIWGLHLIFVKK